MSGSPATIEHAAEGVGGVGSEAAADVRRAWLGELVPDGETIILALKPHPLFVVLNVLWPLGTLLAAGVGAWWLGRSALAGEALEPILRSGPVFAVGAGTLLVAWQCLEWLTRLYVLTDRRIMRVSGVLRQTLFDLPLRRVQHVVLHRSLRERLFGLGTIGFSSAGPGASAEFSWHMIGEPLRQMETVRKAISRYGGGDGNPAAGGEAP